MPKLLKTPGDILDSVAFEGADILFQIKHMFRCVRFLSVGKDLFHVLIFILILKSS